MKIPRLLPSDEEIVNMTLQERSSFGLIVDRYETKLRRYIKRLGILNEDDQLDVLQEIFIKAYRNLNSFDTSLSFSAWIYRIAHNEAISWYRKYKVRPESHLVTDSDELLPLFKAIEENQEQVFDRKLAAVAVRQALDEMDEKYRSVLILRYFEELDYEEISDILKLPIGSVGTLIHRGKKQLQNVLNKSNLT